MGANRARLLLMPSGKRLQELSARLLLFTDSSQAVLAGSLNTQWMSGQNLENLHNPLNVYQMVPRHELLVKIKLHKTEPSISLDVRTVVPPLLLHFKGTEPWEYHLEIAWRKICVSK